MRPARLKQIVGRTAERLHAQGMNDPRFRRAALAFAVAFLTGGIALSLRRHPEVLSGLDWRPALLVVFLGVPITVAFNAYDFALTARLLGRRISGLRALEISILGTAANLLPLPGATLVRVAGLRSAGARYREGFVATLTIGGLWLGIAFLFAGAWLLGTGPAWIALAFLAVGAAAWLGCAVLAVQLSGGIAVPAKATLAKGLLVATDVARILLCFHALGVDASFAQAAAFAVAGALGSAVSVVPAGLGLREGISAVLAPVVGLASGAAFLATALNRLLVLITVVPLALGLILATRMQAVRRDGPA